MSNELKEFTAEEMRGCPSFVISKPFQDHHEFIGLELGRYIVEYFNGDYRDTELTIKCNPIDRCHAICKHLFELMPNAQKILIAGVEVLVMFEESFDELSINPFLHCDITEITREELGL
jgi:hypothetical protein